jgi:release factor glutamine methyltransferase
LAEDVGENLNRLYLSVRRVLRDHGTEKPDLEARWILGHVLGVSDADIIVELSLLTTMSSRRKPGSSAASSEDPGFRRNDIDDERIGAIIRRRLSGEPLSRILGVREFWGLPFELSADTLDPRPDTETLIEAVLERYRDTPPRRILDIGTGSGCILIALLHEFPQAMGVGTDLSAGAVEMARRNTLSNGVSDRASFIQTCWTKGVEGPFDLILSNPPYIPTGVIPNLAPEVKNHDPILALDGGEDGLGAYKVIIKEIKNLLAPGGRIFLETGFDQAGQVARLVAEHGATPERIIPDLGGNPRVVECHMGITKKTVAGDS